MQPNDPVLYAAFKAKDARFDGRFFVGISSTGIYCRPVCRARQPKAEHCSFYATAAEAEQAGYRPCLLCRPEIAPGASKTDAALALAQRAALMLKERCGSGQSLEELAAGLGCTGRHLRRVFMAEYHVSPVQYLQTCRLLLAKSLLTDTRLSVLEVAMAAGFGSLRRFNDLFKTHYRLSPTALRRQAPDQKPHSDGITLALGYRPPYPWEQTLRLFALRAIPGVEAVQNGAYLRTVRLASPQGKPLYGWLRVAHRPKNNTLAVTVSAALLPVLPGVLARVRRLFDTDCDPAAVYETLQAMNHIRPGLCAPGTRLPGCFDAFETAVQAVLEQHASPKAAGALAGRIAETCGTPVHAGIGGLSHVFPAPEDMLALNGPVEEHLGPLGVPAAQARAILRLAEAVARQEITFGPCARPQEEMNKLLAILGIGRWAAGYIALRAMAWPNAFPEADAGVQAALAPHTPAQIAEMAQGWRPWRGYAVVNLWNTL